VSYLSIIYRLLIAFWVGGAALFTFILTPTLFKSFDRDMAVTLWDISRLFQMGLICGFCHWVSVVFGQALDGIS